MNENMTEAPKGQFSNSIFYIIIGFVMLSPFLYAGYLAVANTLPATDADRVKSFTDALFKGLAASIGVGGPLFMFVRSFVLSFFKMQNQPAAKEPTE